MNIDNYSSRLILESLRDTMQASVAKTQKRAYPSSAFDDALGFIKVHGASVLGEQLKLHNEIRTTERWINVINGLLEGY